MAAILTPRLFGAGPPSSLVVSGVGPRPNAGLAAGVMRLPTDPIGTFTLTLTNLVVGSAIRVETQAGALIEYRVADATSEVFTVPAYAPGNAANDLRIKVRKGTAAPFYKDYETLAVASVGAGSIYVVQVPD
jgi:hypothetical protein